jgi:hypothetical protein
VEIRVLIAKDLQEIGREIFFWENSSDFYVFTIFNNQKINYSSIFYVKM